MNEVINSVNFYTPKFNHELKGHTKIVLNNPYRTQVFENDNVVQNAIIEKQFRTMGKYNNSPFSGSWSPLWKTFFGGIFLFNNTISVGSEYMPAGVGMVGNGSVDVVNTGAPLVMGSYDTVKSSITSSMCTQVYNWSQAQGNGDIASVCLTSKVGGYIGYGNSDDTVKTGMTLMNNQYSSNSGEVRNRYQYGNYIYDFSIDTSTKTITISKIPYGISGINIVETTATLTRQYTYNISFGDNAIYFTYNGNSKLAMCETKTVSVGGTLGVVVFDMADDSLTEYEVTNNSSSSWVLANRFLGTKGGPYGFMDNVIFVPAANNSGDTTMFGVRLTDSTVLYTIEHVNTSTDYPCHIFPITPNHCQVLIASKGWCIWDKINNTTYPFNIDIGDIWTSATYDRVPLYGHNVHDDCICKISSGIIATQTCIYKNPLYLGTINNLESIVTKTNEDNMVVTYTLEKVTS